jgi:hypothetical protein
MMTSRDIDITLLDPTLDLIAILQQKVNELTIIVDDILHIMLGFFKALSWKHQPWH